MNYKKYGKTQPMKGGARRVYDFIRKFLGLTEGTPLQRKLSALAYLLFGCAILLAIIVFGVNQFNVTVSISSQVGGSQIKGFWTKLLSMPSLPLLPSSPNL
jgi:magnesium-transporting ATPase (P-type)